MTTASARTAAPTSATGTASNFPDVEEARVTTLSQVLLNTRHRQVQADLRNAHALHQRVMSLVPDDLGEGARTSTGTLFRLDDRDGQVRLLVQTHAPFSAARLPEGYALDVRTLDLSALLARLSEGTRVRYAVIANPSKRSAEGETKGKRVALVGHDAIAWWWERRAQAAGLEITGEPVRIDPAAGVLGRRGGHGGDRITLRASRFEGLATITDATAFTAALLGGIGAGKSYGLGLLTVIPLST